MADIINNKENMHYSSTFMERLGITIEEERRILEMDYPRLNITTNEAFYKGKHIYSDEEWWLLNKKQLDSMSIIG